MTYNDPSGDVIPALVVAIGGGALTGVFSNGLSNAMNGGGFFDGAGKAALWGAVGGAASFGVGSVFGQTGSFLNELGRAGAHALTQGGISAAQGGSFVQGALSGGISSGLSSGASSLGFGDAAMIGVGGLGGGIGSAIGGGNFFQGFGQGIAVGAFNHALHGAVGGPGDRLTEKQKETARLHAADLFMSGEITRQEYLNAITLIDNGTWALVKQVLWRNKEDVALSVVPGGRLLKPLGRLRVPKGELWLDLATGKHLKGGQFASHNASYLKFGNHGTQSIGGRTLQNTRTLHTPQKSWAQQTWESMGRFLGIIN